MTHPSMRPYIENNGLTQDEHFLAVHPEQALSDAVRRSRSARRRMIFKKTKLYFRKRINFNRGQQSIKRNAPLFILAIFCALLFFQCTSTPPNPVEVLDNPLDPSSKTFTKPKTTILSAPSTTTPITEAQATIIVQGNSSTSAFSYALDGKAWSSWNSSPSITLSDLDEGLHQCSIRSLHTDNITVEDDPPIVRFSVNAVAGPSIMFSSRRKEVQFGKEFTYNVVAEEVTSLYGTKLVFVYDQTVIRINSINPGTISNAGVQLLETRNGNRVRAEMFFTGSSTTTGITGTHSIIVINCTPLRTGESLFSFVRDSIQLRSTDNISVTVNQVVDGKIIVQ